MCITEEEGTNNKQVKSMYLSGTIKKYAVKGKKGRTKEWKEMGGSYFIQGIREGLSDKETSEQSSEQTEELSGLRGVFGAVETA